MKNSKGHVFYVVGPSGAGKDTLLEEARKRVAGEIPLFFAHRYITRPARYGGENHVALSVEEFLLRKRFHAFVMDWLSHGNYYGIGSEINTWIAQGASVVINGSRAYLADALQKYPGLYVVSVEAEPALIQERLQRRGRENGQEIQARISRSAELESFPLPFNTIRIDNNGMIEASVAALIQAIKEVM